MLGYNIGFGVLGLGMFRVKELNSGYFIGETI